MALNKAKQTKKDTEAKAYINPEKAEEHRQKGNELFKDGNFPGAIKEYDEGVKRDPSAVAIYSNRCATYIKLMVMDQALKDAEKCIELDPKFAKAYLRKGNCHHLMKEYHKAMKTYDEGLKLEPDNAEIKAAQQKTIMAIQMGSSAGGGDDNARAEQAMKDPEIQQIMMDPMVKIVLERMQTDPKAAQEVMQDPNMAAKINKLIMAGIIKVA